jgi:hypothetical protein
MGEDDESMGLVGRQVSRVVGAVVPPVVDSIDVQALIEEVDLNELLDRIDMDALLERVDVEGLVARIDVNALLEDVDLNALLDGIDIDALLDRIDLEALMRKARIGDLVAESTGQVAGSALDLGRRQVVGLDVMIMRAINRIMRRSPDELPAGPPLLVAEGDQAV